jgi:serpin B
VVDTNGTDWLATALDPLRTAPSSDAWPSAAEIGRRASRRRRRRAVGSALGVLVVGLAILLVVALVAIPGEGPRGAQASVARHVAGPYGSVHLVASVDHSRASDAQVMADVAADEEAFALDLTRREVSYAPTSNVVLSPLSADIDLSMLELGAGGATQRAIASALQSEGMSPNENAAGWGQLVSSEVAGSPAGGLTVADSLWVERHLHVQTAFLRLDAADFGNDTYQVNFASPSATQAINAWVDQATGGRIVQLFAAGELAPTTVVVLANALHLQARWATAHEFSTKSQAFITAGGASVSVPTLTASDAQLAAAVTHSYQAVQIPLAGGQLAALVIEPSQGTLQTWLERLTPEALGSMVASLSRGAVDLTMPALNLSNRPVLNKPLSAMGMASAFQTADLVPMLGGTATKNLYVATVQQADVLQLNSGGIDAAASTGTSIGITAVEQARRITIDHPYLLLVRDTKTGAILFSSAVNDPAES